METHVSKNYSHTLGIGTDSQSFELESWSYVQHKDFQVNVLRKPRPSKRGGRYLFPTKPSERLAFLRGYFTTPCKLQIVYLQQMEFSTFFWLYVKNVFFRSISSNYVHVFLSVYNPSEHMFSSKLSPIMYGVSWQVVLCGLTQLVWSADVLSMFMAYGFGWVINELPFWNCPKKYYTLPPNKEPYQCMTLKEFKNITLNYGVNDKTQRVLLKNNFYMFNYLPEHKKKEHLFTPAPIHHFMHVYTKTSVLEYNSYLWIILYAIIWISAGAFYKQLYRRYMWKILDRSQSLLNVLYLIVLMFITYMYVETGLRPHNRIYDNTSVSLASKWDFDFLAESPSAPPVINILYARAPQQVIPARDSTLITLTTGLTYFFKSLVNYMLKSYVESVFKGTISMSPLNPFPVFYLWHFFFQSFAFGNLSIRVFYGVSFILEFLIFTITFQILVEAMVCEWKITRRIVSTILLSLTGLVMSSLIHGMTKTTIYVVTTSITSLTEVIILCWFYPLTRLLDDIHFTNGNPVPNWRKWGFRFWPFYHLSAWLVIMCIISQYKTYNTLNTYYGQVEKHGKKKSEKIMEDTSAAIWAWGLPLVPLGLGIFYSALKFVILQKQKWRVLLRPRPDWGPTEHVTRQLRKQFDYSHYIGSQAPRFLCRHMLDKSRTPKYNLEVCYESNDQRRRSTAVGKI